VFQGPLAIPASETSPSAAPPSPEQSQSSRDSHGAESHRCVRGAADTCPLTVSRRRSPRPHIPLQDRTKSGFTNAAIDSITCPPVDPQIHILQGHILTNPGWSAEAFSNLNNHSLVTRVDFNGASLLFMGDWEEEGIGLLLNFYTGAARQILNADVLQVGHHGSNNATTQELLDAITPSVAVINVGRWNYGSPNKPFTTFLYGHPRQSTLDLLQSTIARTRKPSKSVMAAESSKHFHVTTVRKAIYATGWDGTVRAVVKGKDDITVYRER